MQTTGQNRATMTFKLKVRGPDTKISAGDCSYWESMHQSQKFGIDSSCTIL